MIDTNGLSALLGGYSGLLMGMLFLMIVHMIFARTSYLQMLPIIMLIAVVGLSMYYLSSNFDKIAKGEVSSYYVNFSILSAIFMFTQVGIIFKAVYETQGQTNKLFKDTTNSLLRLLGVINILIVITVGIVLQFYSTQG